MGNGQPGARPFNRRSKPHPITTYDPDTLAAMREGYHLNEAQKGFRTRFLEEYVKDFNATRAYLRCGVSDNYNTAKNLGRKLLEEPYVLLQLEAILRERRTTDIVTRNQVLKQLWLEANNERNSGKERIAALALLARALGMLTDYITETPETPQTVMFVPLMDANEWERAAQNAQLSLKAKATTVPVACPPPPPPGNGRTITLAN